MTGTEHYGITVYLEDTHERFTDVVSSGVIDEMVMNGIIKLNAVKYSDQLRNMPIRVTLRTSDIGVRNIVYIAPDHDTEGFINAQVAKLPVMQPEVATRETQLIYANPFEDHQRQDHGIQPFLGSCISIIDGDTIGVRANSGSINDNMQGSYSDIRIRLLGIDAPEINEPGGPESARFLENLILNQNVYIDVCTHQANNDGDVGQDRFNRWVANVYLVVPSEAQPAANSYVHVNKTMLVNGYAEIMIWRDLDTGRAVCTETVDWQQYQIAARADLAGIHSLDPDSNITAVGRIDDRPEMGYNDLRIGDCCFQVPPEAIRVLNQRNLTHVPSMRARGSTKTNPGHGVKRIQLDLYFHDEDSINGTPVNKQHHPGRMYIPSNTTYYINGLRSLIAQFRRTPFLPVDNEYLNIDHDIYSVTLQGLTVSTVPGFPGSLKAELTLYEFNYDAYMPDEPDFAETFCWPLFRYYYQKDLLAEEGYQADLVSGGRTTHYSNRPGLAKFRHKTNMNDQKFLFSIASEPQLQAMSGAMKELDTTDPPSREEILNTYRNTPLGRTVRDGQLMEQAIIQRDLYIAWRDNIIKEPDRRFTAEWPDWNFWVLGQQAVDAAIRVAASMQTSDFRDVLHAAGISTENQLFFPAHSLWRTGHNIYDEGIPTGRFTRDTIAVPITDETNRANAGRWFNNIIGSWGIGGKLVEWVAQEDRLPIHVEPDRDIKIIEDIIRRGQEALETLNREVDRQFSVAQQEYDELTGRAVPGEDRLDMEAYPIDDIQVTNIAVYHENIITDLQTQGQDTPAHQYLGSQDVYVRLTMQTNSREAISSLTALANTVGHYARNYRHYITTGFLDISNDIINMFGVHSVLIENIAVDTIPGTPELFQVEMTLVDFDKTQRSRQALAPIMGPHDIHDSMSHSDIKELLETVTHETSDSGVRFEQYMKNMELYPDLALPTYQEVTNVMVDMGIGPFFPNPHTATFVDPDFYISKPYTVRELLREQLHTSHAMELTDIAYYGTGGSVLKAQTHTPIGDREGTPVYNDAAKSAMNEVQQAAGLDLSFSKYSNDPWVSTVADRGPTTIPDIDAVKSTSRQRDIKTIVDATPTSSETRGWSTRSFENPGVEDISKAVSKAIGDHFATRLNVWLNNSQLVDWHRIVMGLINTGSNYQQFTRTVEYNPGDPHGANRIIPVTGTNGQVGLMQVNPRRLYYTDSPDEERIRRIAWDWQYNIDQGVGLLADIYNEVRKNPKYSDDAIQWAIVHYAARNKDTVVTTTDYRTEPIHEELRNYQTPVDMSGPIGWVDPLKQAAVSTWELLAPVPTRADMESFARTWQFINPLTPLYAGEETPSYGEGPGEDDPRDSYGPSCKDLLEYDMRGRLARAFPTFQLFIVDEGRWLSWHRLWDNLYGYQAVSSIDVHKSRKQAADTCVLVLNNTYDTLNRRDPNVAYGDYGFNLWHFLWPWLSPTEEMLAMRKRSLQSLFLRTGARIHLRMGYGSNAAKLPIVFNGAITELDIQDVATVIAQGDGIELTNKLEVDNPNATTGGWKLLGEKEPRNLIMWLLDDRTFYEKWLKGGSLKLHTVPRGVVHFGNPVYKPFDREVEIGQNIYTATKGRTKWDTSAEKYRTEPQPAWEWLWLPFRAGVDEPNLYIYAYNKTAWDLIQICAMAIPDYRAWVHPFELRSTLFYGRPYWGLGYKYEHKVSLDNEGNIDTIDLELARKPMQQFRLYHSFTDILSNQIKASEEDVYTNVIGMYSTDDYDNPNRQVLVSADTDIYPELQRTTIVHTELSTRPVTGGWHTLSGATSQFGAAVDRLSPHGTPRLANNIAVSALVNYLKDMYKGQLTVLGDPSVKPHDLAYIFDTYNMMMGNIEVESVVHSFGQNTGFITSITPDACVSAVDPWNVQRWQWYASLGIVAGLEITGMACSTQLLRGAARVYHWQAARLVGLGGAFKPIGSALKSLGLKAGGKVPSALVPGYLSKTAIGAKDTFLAIIGKGAPTTMSKALTAKFSAKTALGAMMVKALPAIIIGSVLFIVSEGLIELYSRKLQNRQAVIIAPLTLHGREFSAGIHGHQGCVVGDEPGKVDKALQKWLGWLLRFDYNAGERAVDYWPQDDMNVSLREWR